MAATASTQLEKDMPNVNNSLRIKQGDMLFEWQAAVAILEEEYKFRSTDKAVIDQSRYEFASHLLDIHRMRCAVCPRTIAGSLPVRSVRDTAGAGVASAALRQSHQELDQQKRKTDGKYGLQSNAPTSQPDDNFEDYDDRKDNMIATDIPTAVTCHGEDDELQADGNTACTEKSLDEIQCIIVKQEDCDDESIQENEEEEQRVDGWIEVNANRHLAGGERRVHNNPSSSTLGCDELSPEGASQDICNAEGEKIMHDYNVPSTSTFSCDEGSFVVTLQDDGGIEGDKNMQNTSRFDEEQSSMNTGHQQPIPLKPHQCSECMKRFTVKGALKVHMRSHTGEKPYQCSVCDKAFSTSSYLSSHMRRHTGEKPYQCSVCNKAFTTNSYLSRHLRLHTGEKPYQCSACNKTFKDSGHLTYHMRTHTGEKPYQCSVCNKSFLHSSNLTCHMRHHTGEKPYQCSVCDKAFISSSSLTYHMRTHTGDKPYQCSICNKAFSSNGNLSCHMRLHTGEKPYQCTLCDKAFTYSSHHIYHMRTHTGEKPYQCSVCNKAFPNGSNLSCHMKIHSRENPC